MELRLPYAPTINHYYGFNKKSGSRFLTKQAKEFREAVSAIVASEASFGVKRLSVSIELHPPRKGGDIDNRIKPTLDALEAAGLFENDSQIDMLQVVRRYCMLGGAMFVTVKEVNRCLM